MIHIDLLKPSERRFQGAAGGKFLLVAGAGFLLLLSLLGAIHLWTSVESLRQELQRAESAWEDLQPRQARLLEIKKASEEMEKLINEAGEWASTRMEWSRILDHVQDVTSATTQITRMEIKDDLREPAAPPNTKKSPPPLRFFTMKLSVRIYDARAVMQAGMLISALRDYTIDGQTVFQSLELQNVQVGGHADVQSFVIDARGTERVLK